MLEKLRIMGLLLVIVAAGMSLERILVKHQLNCIVQMLIGIIGGTLILVSILIILTRKK